MIFNAKETERFDIKYTVQEIPNGLAGAILTAEKYVVPYAKALIQPLRPFLPAIKKSFTDLERFLV